jgi:hypothetical protein
MGNISKTHWQLMADMLYKCDKQLLHWASISVPNWKNISLPNDYLHIHGKEDLLLPPKYIKGAQFILEAGHLAILTHSDAINTLIAQSVY